MSKEEPDVFEAIELNQNPSFKFFIKKAKTEGWNEALQEIEKKLVIHPERRYNERYIKDIIEALRRKE